MPTSVHFLGGAQTDFARNVAREGKELADLVHEVTLGALEDAALDAAAIQSIHVGNAFGELFTGQAQMGALPATMLAALDGVPAARHEGACASGSLAILAAAAEIEAGRYDCVLVVGAEQERNVPGEVAARHFGTAACRQVTGRAGDTQVPGATRFGTLNIGGSATTVVTFVWGSS